MAKCPDCYEEINGKDLRKQPSLRAYRECPFCQCRFIVDPATKQKQLVAILIGLVLLFVTVNWYFQGGFWLLPTVVISAILFMYIYKANKKVVFKKYNES